MSNPIIDRLTPSTGPVAGGTEVTIGGDNFQTGCMVKLGRLLVPSTFVDPKTLKATTPPAREMTPGDVNVRVINPNGAFGVLPNGFTYTMDEDSGEVTVDGFLLTYLGAPLGCDSTTSWSISRSLGTTFRLSSSQDRSISFTTEVSTSTPFTAGGSVTFTQSSSTEVSNALTIRRSKTVTYETPAPGPSRTRSSSA